MGFDKFMTGRMDFRLKTGLRACSKAGGSGREQFTIMELHGATRGNANIDDYNLTVKGFFLNYI